MDVHLELGIHRLLDLTPKKIEMTASVKGEKNHGPCIENNLELESGGGCENWVDGSKTGRLTDCGGVPREISAKY